MFECSSVFLPHSPTSITFFGTRRHTSAGTSYAIWKSFCRLAIAGHKSDRRGKLVMSFAAMRCAMHRLGPQPCRVSGVTSPMEPKGSEPGVTGPVRTVQQGSFTAR